MTPEQQERVDEIARLLAGYLGPGWDAMYQNKREWIDDRGARQPDVNGPFRDDCIEAATAILSLLQSRPSPAAQRISGDRANAGQPEGSAQAPRATLTEEERQHLLSKLMERAHEDYEPLLGITMNAGEVGPRPTRWLINVVYARMVFEQFLADRLTTTAAPSVPDATEAPRATTTRELELENAVPFTPEELAENRRAFINTAFPLDKEQWARLLRTAEAPRAAILEELNKLYAELRSQFRVSDHPGNRAAARMYADQARGVQMAIDRLTAKGE